MRRETSRTQRKEGLQHKTDAKPYTKRRKVSRFRWTQQEETLYINFLKEHIQQFSTAQKRWQSKVFSRMAEVIPTKSRPKCKSHHQKLLKQFQTVKAILFAYEIYSYQLSKNNEFCPSKSKTSKQQHKHSNITQTNVESSKVQGEKIVVEIQPHKLQNSSIETQLSENMYIFNDLHSAPSFIDPYDDLWFQ